MFGMVTVMHKSSQSPSGHVFKVLSAGFRVHKILPHTQAVFEVIGSILLFACGANRRTQLGFLKKSKRLKPLLTL